MGTRRRMPFVGMIGLASAAATPLCAQPQPVVAATNSPAEIAMPNLTYTPDPEIERNYFKYFYFHRDDADFDTAYSDLQECDGYARGIAYRAGNGNAYMPMYGVGGVVGGAIGNALADAIFGSSERRRLRRVNMRTCMGFKGYRAYGLPRNLWREFNFDEGNSQMEDERRDTYLRQQARVASGPHPVQGEMPQ